MSNLKQEVLDRFLADPESMFNGNFDFWGTSSFVNASGILEWLMSNRPHSPLIPRVTKQMLDYMKYCYDNNKEFPWEGTFPPTPQKDSKAQFIEYYNSVVNGPTTQ
jgi:hypothetical protein